MPLVPMKTLLDKAEKENYAVGAFNCNNMEIVQAIVAAAAAEKSPVIIQASQGAIKYAGLPYIMALVRVSAEQTDVPIAMHLDHGTGFEQCIRCIQSGFTSVMVDGSKLSLEENIALTKKVTEIARIAGVSVEAELGKIAGVEDDIFVNDREACFTDPDEAKTFVDATGVDALAVAVGTAHGQYKGEPKLDYERISAIKEKVRIPIVLHGSSGVPDEAIAEAIRRGVSKVNIDTNIRQNFVAKIREVLNEDDKVIDPRKILGPAKEKAVEVIRQKIQVFGSSGKA